MQAQRIWGNPMGQYVYNPAGAAMNDLGEVAASYYNTYASATNSPQGFLLMGSGSFPSDKVGAGFRFTNESGGVLKTTMAEATFVYKTPVSRNSKLSFGLSAVYNQLGFAWDKMNPQHQNDPILVNAANAGYYFDANFGVSLNEANRYYIGLACYNLLGQQTSWLLPSFTNRSSRLVSLSGMYSFNLLHGDAKLETTGVLMTYQPQDEFTPVYDLSARLIYRKSGWLGAGYTNHMVKVLCGLYIQDLAIGYAGGIGIGDISDYGYAFPKHELFLRLELNTSKSSRTPAY
jgi:type IX secretion system PorP/SprF family membrane protein